MNINKLEKFLSSDQGSSFCITFLFHCVILFLLALIISYPEFNQTSIIIESSLVNNEEVLENETIEIAENISEVSSLTNIEEIPEVEQSSLIVDTPEPPSMIDNDVSVDSDAISFESLNDHVSGLQNNIGGGFSTQTSTGGALDRLTLEIINNAQTKDLTVVWLFDASISLNHQRQQIYSRFDKILDELDSAPHIKRVNHSIVSFGQSFNILSIEPTNNIETLKSDILKISLDDSGIENTFNAIGQTCQKFHVPFQRLMIVVFTDEIGDDIQLLDKVSALASSKGSMIYVVGNPAPFGKSSTQFRFVEFDPKYESTEKWVEINQGPETLHGMILDLRSLAIDEETLDSGFGPFALSKLCADTGGIFFSVHPNRSSDKIHKKDIAPLSSYISRFFDHEVMIAYKPDYRSLTLQNKEDSTNITKSALLKACSIPLHITGHQILRFRAFNEGMFVEELSMAQRFSAKLEPHINQVYNALLIGEPSYPLLKDKRWIASYALAMGRILSTKCRIECYNLVLAEAKSGLKKRDPKSNIWILIPSKEFSSSNSVLRKNYETSQRYLRYVIDNFPDTPWALIAQQELDTPVGYIWVEEYESPPKPNDGGGNNNRQDDKMKPKLIPKPTRKIGKI